MAAQKTTIPLIFPATARGWAASVGTSAKDQQLINGLYQVSENSQAGSKAVYAQKRSGSTTSNSIGSGVVVLKCYDTNFVTLSSTGTALYKGTTNIGTITAQLYDLTNYLVADMVIGSVSVIAFATSDGAGWYCYSDAVTSNFPTFTADTHSNTTIDNIGGTGAATTGIYVGQAVSGTGIPVGARVATVSATSFTITQAATGTATITVTKEALSKIIDTDFPTDTLSMAAMDGYFFASSGSLGICQSAINDPSSWSTADRIKPDWAGDQLQMIFKSANYVVAVGALYSIQYFYNNGNSSGSVLSQAENLNILGLQIVSLPVPFRDGMYLIAQPGGPSAASSTFGLYRLTGVNSYQRVSDDYWSSVIVDNNLWRIGSIEGSNKMLVACHYNNVSTFPVYDINNGFSLLSTSAALTSSHGATFTKSGASTLFSWAANNTWTDSSSAYTLTAQTQPYTLNDGASFIINYVDLIADTEASGTATLYISEDDYATWQNVGTFDMTQAIKRIDAIGWIPSNVAFKVEHSANTNFRAQALVVNWTPCGR